MPCLLCLCRLFGILALLLPCPLLRTLLQPRPPQRPSTSIWHTLSLELRVFFCLVFSSHIRSAAFFSRSDVSGPSVDAPHLDPTPLPEPKKILTLSTRKFASEAHVKAVTRKCLNSYVAQQPRRVYPSSACQDKGILCRPFCSAIPALATTKSRR